MRLSWQPQAHWVLSGSWSISVRGSSAGSGARLGCCRGSRLAGSGRAASSSASMAAILLANIYLHYVLDLWARQWRQRHARGDVIIVRYADDSVVGFRMKVQAQQFLVQLQERLARFGLSLNASKTRLIEFGRFAARNRRKRGLGKPETFDFLGFSYGFRPGRSQHDALDALTVALKGQKVNWILDADITSFFDEIDHEWMLMFLGHRIADRRLLGLICKWLQAGVMEDGRRVAATKGTPQGAVISPLLANIYLHYVLDLWAGQWRERHARGDVIVVRYADDSVVGFRLKSQAQRFLEQLRERLARFGLSLNASKTRLIEFGRFAARNRRDRGLGRPETFDFLGFTHCCSSNRNGGFQILRLTVKKRMRATLLAIRDELKRRRHEPIRVQGQWLTRVVSGYFNYHAVPGNLIRLGGFRSAVCRLWRQALKRRSQRNRLQWSRCGRLADLYIPRPRNAHPYPEDRFASHTRGRSRMR